MLQEGRIDCYMRDDEGNLAFSLFDVFMLLVFRIYFH